MMRWLLTLLLVAAFFIYVTFCCGGEDGKLQQHGKEMFLRKEVEGWKEVRARISHYCAGGGCGNPVCGTNSKTAFGRDSSIGDGVAVAPNCIRLGSLIRIGGRVYVADDTGAAMRKAWREKKEIWIDIRVAGLTHKQVAALGVRYETIWVKYPERRK